MKWDRNSTEYQLAERIIFLAAALTRANQMLNADGKLGVLPDSGPVRFREAAKHHAKVRTVLKNI